MSLKPYKRKTLLDKIEEKAEAEKLEKLEKTEEVKVKPKKLGKGRSK